MTNESGTPWPADAGAGLVIAVVAAGAETVGALPPLPAVAIQAGEWRRAEQLLPAKLSTSEARDYAVAVYELKATDRNLLLQERKEAEREVERLSQGSTVDYRRAPMSPELYE